MKNIININETFVSTTAIYCKFYLKKKFTKEDPYQHVTHAFDLSQKYCLLVAWSDRFYYTSANLTGMIFSINFNAILTAGTQHYYYII